MIAINTPTAQDMEKAITKACNNNVGYVYVTDANLPNPYNAVPSYWT